MKAQNIFDYLRSLDGGWVDWNDTTDRFIAGDPESEVTGIAVAWMSYRSALERAQELGCNLFVTHEPTFFSHHDDDDAMLRFPGVHAKHRWVEESGMAILRCHDVWDQRPDIGIPDSWAELLGFRDPVVVDGYYRVFEVAERTAREIAGEVARSVRSLGQDAVELIGPGDAMVRRITLGTGAITHFPHMLQAYEPDLAICTDDGFTYWHGGALAIDLGVPVIVVNHAVSEIHGIRLLADRLAVQFPDVPVHFISQSCMYELVAGQ